MRGRRRLILYGMRLVKDWHGMIRAGIGSLLGSSRFFGGECLESHFCLGVLFSFFLCFCFVFACAACNSWLSHRKTLKLKP